VPRSTRSLTLTIGALALAAAACGGGAPQEAIDAQPLACPTDSDCYDPPRAVGEGGQIAFDADEFVRSQRDVPVLAGEAASAHPRAWPAHVKRGGAGVASSACSRACGRGAPRAWRPDQLQAGLGTVR
jgi:hypothetical protein